MDYSILDENSNDEEKSIHDEEFLEKLFELKEKYKHEADLCWM